MVDSSPLDDQQVAQASVSRPRRLRWILGGIAVAVVSLTVVVGVVRWQARSGRGAIAVAVAAEAAGDYPRAAALLRDAAARFPDQLAIVGEAARMNAQAGFVAEAVPLARQAWEGGVRDVSLAAILIAHDPALSSDEDGLRRSEVLIAQLPEEADRLRLRAQILVRRKQWDAVVPILTQLVSLSPHDAVAASALAETYLTLNKPAQAAAVLEPLVAQNEIDANGARLLALAWVTASLSQRDETIDVRIQQLMTQTLARFPTDYQLQFEAAQYALMQHQGGTARGLLAEVIASSPDLTLRTQAFLLDGWIALNQGTFADWCAKPCGFAGPGAEAIGIIQTGVHADSPGDAKNTDGLIFILQKVDRLVKGGAPYAALAGRLLADHREPQESLGYYRRVTGLLAFCPAILLEQAEVQHQLGNDAEASALIMDVHRYHHPTKKSLLLLEKLSAQLVSLTERQALARIARRAQADADLRSVAVKLDVDGLSQWLQSQLKSGATWPQAGLDAAVQGLSAGNESSLTALSALPLSPAALATVQALGAQALGQHSQALASFRTARDQGAPPIFASQEAYSAVMVQDLTAAQQAAERALQARPSHVATWRLLVLTAADNEPLLRSLAERLQALPSGTLSQNDREYIQAEIALQLGDNDQAINWLRAIIARDPTHEGAVCLMSDWWCQQQQPELAYAALRQLAGVRSDHVLVRRMVSALMIKNYTAALADLDASSPAIQQICSRDGVRVAVYLGMGDSAGAHRAVDQLPSDIPASQRAIWLARVLEQSQRTSAAMAALEPYLEDDMCAWEWARLAWIGQSDADIAARLAATKLAGPTLRRIAGIAGAQERWMSAYQVMTLALQRSPDDIAVVNDFVWYGWKAQQITQPDAHSRLQSILPKAPQSSVIVETYLAIAYASQAWADMMSVAHDYPQAVQTSAVNRFYAAVATCETNGDRIESLKNLQEILQVSESDWSLPVSRAEVNAAWQRYSSAAIDADATTTAPKSP